MAKPKKLLLIRAAMLDGFIITGMECGVRGEGVQVNADCRQECYCVCLCVKSISMNGMRTTVVTF